MLDRYRKAKVQMTLVEAANLIRDVQELAKDQDEQVENTARLYAEAVDNFAEYVEAQT